MDSLLAGRRILVTGASRGIGLAVSRELAGAGAWVAMVSRNTTLVAGLAAEVGGHPFQADISSVSDIGALAGAVEEEIGGAPDAIVNSAGAFALAPLAETTPEDFDRQLAVNLRGPFLVIRAFLPAMIARGSGHIVNVGSIAGRIALPGNAGYGASKFGLRGLHGVLAAELAGSGLRTTLIEPAATDTPLWDAVDPDSRADLPSRIQMLRPADVARSVRFALEQPAGVEISSLAIRAAH